MSARTLIDLVLDDDTFVSWDTPVDLGGHDAAYGRVVAAEHGWLAPLPPEGASMIVHHDTARAQDLAEHQQVGAHALLADGFVDVVVPERPRRTRTPAGSCVRWWRNALRVSESSPSPGPPA